MAGIKIVTRKLVPWHGRDEEFSNVYYFGDGDLGLTPSEENTASLINMVITEEKKLFGNNVRFLGGAGYKVGAANTAGDTPAVSVVELAATGNQGALIPTTGMYVECAIDIRWLLGGRRYLRTMLHTCNANGYPTNGVTAAQSTDLAATLKAYAEKMLNGTWVGGLQRIAPNGDRPTAIQYQPYLEHRQFHRYRRRNAGLLG